MKLTLLTVGIIGLFNVSSVVCGLGVVKPCVTSKVCKQAQGYKCQQFKCTYDDPDGIETSHTRKYCVLDSDKTINLVTGVICKR